ncbi:cell division protein FtsN [mine drainage metagenome]|uniref:Cell division protein FtsN n=1 Tax=mine drainage metagenome TaxID=410659 RepID=A0A1J5QTD7_9ZZZZ
MTRDYKPAQQKAKPASRGSSFFAGFLTGLILGIGISVGVAIVVKGGESPFVARDASPSHADAGPKADAPAEKAKPDATEAKAPAKPRFDFYTILPGSESPVTEQEVKQSKASQQRGATEAGGETYYLQVGAFQTEQEADNMKAKLALLGLEAVVQSVTVPDKGVWQRVRVGPFSEIDQITRARAELTKNGFNADLIKIHNNVPDQ